MDKRKRVKGRSAVVCDAFRSPLSQRGRSVKIYVGIEQSFPVRRRSNGGKFDDIFFVLRLGDACILRVVGDLSVF